MPIRVVSPGFGHIPIEAVADQARPQRLSYYFFLFVFKGTKHITIDTASIDIGENELVFLLPHQIRDTGDLVHAESYFKLGFDEECMSRLPRPYPFLLDPLHRQKIKFSQMAANRLKAIFSMLQELLNTPKSAPELILAHLNSLLTEIDAAYFTGQEKPADDQISRFINFKVFVEDHLTEHQSIKAIADKLAISSFGLHQIVKQHSGLSPKEFINERLILEAKRRIYYGQHLSVKELAFELGFNDPDYFSRVFKKVTGKTVASFFRDI